MMSRSGPRGLLTIQRHRNIMQSMYEIVRTARGKISVVSEGSCQKMRDRLAQLRHSTRGGVSGRGKKKYSVTYTLRPKTPDSST
jgi:hypothetical protein